MKVFESSDTVLVLVFNKRLCLQLGVDKILKTCFWYCHSVEKNSPLRYCFTNNISLMVTSMLQSIDL